jgi:N6-adenosine-specific RNA methylase IME4
MLKRKYGVIVADPPWRFDDKLKYGGKVIRGVSDMYPTLGISEIKGLPVGAVADENCLLALWVPSAFLQAGLEVMNAWGFDYRQLWIWGKTAKTNPNKLAFGMGRLGRNCHEPCLIGIKGKYTKHLQDHSQRNLFLHPTTKHSAKPEQLQDSLELMFPEWKKLELFARRDRPNWDCIGNECPSTLNEDVRDSLARMITGTNLKSCQTG